MHHANIVLNVVTGLQKVLQQEQAPTDNPTIIPEPVDHVVNKVQSTQQQLTTHLHQMQVVMQVIQMQYAAAPHETHQDYGGLQDYVGRGYQGNQSIYRSQSGNGKQNISNWCGGRGGRSNINLKHYCWTHIICTHPGKDFRTSEDGQ